MENIIKTDSGRYTNSDVISTNIAFSCDVVDEREKSVEANRVSSKVRRQLPLATTMMLFAVTSQLPQLDTPLLQGNDIHSYLDQSSSEVQDAVKSAISRSVDLLVEQEAYDRIENKYYIDSVFQVASSIKRYLKGQKVSFELSYFHSYHEDYEHMLLKVLGLEQSEFEEKFEIEDHIVEKLIPSEGFDELPLVVEVV